MAFLDYCCVRTALTPSILAHSNVFSCGELLDYIKQWFIDPDNKTGCRYLVVDAYNQPVPLAFYEANGFKFMFSSEQQECEYRNIDATKKLHTRMMYTWSKL